VRAQISALVLISLTACGSPAALGPDASSLVPPIDASAGSDVDAAPPDPNIVEVWSTKTLYLVLTDRFANGDTTNDALGPAGCFDPADPKKFHGGDLAGVRQRIPYLRELGVTAIWILPVYLQSPDRCGYHGYWADFTDPDDGAIQPTLGGADDLHGLIDDAHAAGMRVVLDMVVNHSGKAARVLTQHPSWFHDPTTCSTLGDPSVYCPIGSKLPDFAQEQPVVAAYLSAMSVGWTQRFAIDGIRMDTVKNVPPAYFHDSWFPAIRAGRPLFTVGEVFDEGAATDLSPYLNAGFDSLFNYPLYPVLVATFAKGGSVNALADKVKEELAAFGLLRTTMLSTFLDNHDNPRFVSQIPTTTVVDDARRHYHMALAALFALPGIPQLYYGDELALYGGPDPDNRRDMPSWAWDAAMRPGAHGTDSLPDPQLTFALVQTLIAARAKHPALSAGAYAEMWRQGGLAANVFAFARRDAASGDVVVAAFNAGAADSGALHISAHPAGLADGTMLDDLLGGAGGAPATLSVTGGGFTLDLPPLAVGLYAPR
jgi:glycosidase